MAPRSSYLGWGTTGQFAEVVVDALNYTSYRSYNTTFGTVVGEHDANGVSRSWQYDAFGRLIREDRPDVTATTYTYYACGAPYACIDGNNRVAVLTSELASNGSVITDSVTYYDTLDRVQGRAGRLPNGSYNWVNTKYDALGRIDLDNYLRSYLDGALLCLDFCSGGEVGLTKAVLFTAIKDLRRVASEKTAKDVARRIERDLGVDARNQFHDMKEPGAPDRTFAELKSHARELYEAAGWEVPGWLK